MFNALPMLQNSIAATSQVMTLYPQMHKHFKRMDTSKAVIALHQYLIVKFNR